MNTYHISGTAKCIDVENERYFHYAKGSEERKQLLEACARLRNIKEPIEVPCVVNGEEVKTGKTLTITFPSDNKKPMFKVHLATPELMKKAIEGALEAKEKWERMSLEQRSAVFLKVSDRLSTPDYRNELNAAIMMVQGKTMWQAEIDLAEMIDFWRFNVQYAFDIYAKQPPKNFKGCWNKTEMRALEGFVTSVTPFNFASIASNLNCSPVLMGNASLWKTGTSTALVGYKIYKLLEECGLPAGVIQFLPSRGVDFSKACFSHKYFAGLHFTGGTTTFNTLLKEIYNNIDNLVSYPRIVGETGGKNFHIMHESAEELNFINCTMRGAFEYSGQKCSATSRAYVPKKLWDNGLKEKMIAAVKTLKYGQPDDATSFSSCVIDEKAYKKIKGFIDRAREGKETKVIVGGECDDSKGWFINPTIIETSNPKSETMEQEIFGPVLTIYPYEGTFEETCKLLDQTAAYSLTGAVFAKDRYAICKAMDLLRNSSGNFYINDKSTGAVVGQQPFGGARKSGNNAKAGSELNLHQWVSVRAIKENFVPCKSPFYPSIDLN